MTQAGIALVALMCGVIAVLLSIIAIVAPLLSQRAAVRRRIDELSAPYGDQPRIDPLFHNGTNKR